jgi:hypothetical protein
MRLLFMAAKQGPSVLFCMPNRTKCALLAHVVLAAQQDKEEAGPSAAPALARPQMRVVSYYGHWLCNCGRENALWDVCSCGQAAPCRDWVRGRCEYKACRCAVPAFPACLSFSLSVCPSICPPVRLFPRLPVRHDQWRFGQVDLARGGSRTLKNTRNFENTKDSIDPAGSRTLENTKHQRQH